MSRHTIAIALTILAAAATAASAKTYDAVAQFSTVVNNDTNIWSYRASDGKGHDGNYALLTDTGSISFTKHGKPLMLTDWDTPNAPFTVPVFVANKAKATIKFLSNGQQVAFPAKTMDYHPGYSNVAAVLSILARTGGTATVTYDFTHLDWSCGTNGAGIDWSIEKNFGNGSLANGHLYSPDKKHVDSTGAQKLTVTVAKGDRINFIVDGVANPPYCDSTGLSATVSLP